MGYWLEHWLKTIKSGEATPAHLNVVRQFLRDNNIECLGTNNEDIRALVEELPFSTDNLRTN